MTEAATRTPVVDFDYQSDPALLEDVHAGYMHLAKTAPPVFWTPRHGGHWVTTTAKTSIEVLRRHDIFSNQFLSIPPNPNQPKMIPESLDPPEHRAYRQLLRPYFESKAIAPLEPRIIEWTETIIDAVAGKGECEFFEAVASRLPVSVFMEMFGFPLDRFEYFRSLVTGYFNAQTAPDERMRLAGEITGAIAQLITARTAEPQNDLVSALISVDFDGRRLEFHELMSIGFLMFLAGLDTVTNAMTFGMRHLAHDETLRQRIIDDPSCIPAVVEELMRRYVFVTTPRYITADYELGGAHLKAGDSILVPLAMVGWDPAMTKDPETVSIDRPTCKHAGFGSGIHTCLGIHLARLELATFYRIWFEKIGHFDQVPTAEKQRMRAGSVMALETLQLGWETRK
ncbi:MAG: cytochrome P450 [Polymorphobacter sp.]